MFLGSTASKKEYSKIIPTAVLQQNRLDPIHLPVGLGVFSTVIGFPTTMWIGFLNLEYNRILK